jgi:hypothetical protein
MALWWLVYSLLVTILFGVFCSYRDALMMFALLEVQSWVVAVCLRACFHRRQPRVGGMVLGHTEVMQKEVWQAASAHVHVGNMIQL